MRGGDAFARLFVGPVAHCGDLGADLCLEAFGLLAAGGRAGDGLGELGVGVVEELLRLCDRLLVGGG